ncbi:hypothetical protein [Actinomadura sp. 9N215]|uniref:hypothetical protein n=1 Tax=Actinomadura sp. 9N215 TaxID=3375150 RepID=UPI003791AB60
MKITFSVEGGPRLLAVLSAVTSAAAILYIALGHQLALSEAVQLAVVSGYGQVTAFVAGLRA